MLEKIKHWLEPPSFPGDEEKTAQARMMNTVGLYFLLALTVSAIVFVPFFAKHKSESFAVIFALYGIYSIARHFMFRGQLALASGFMVGAGWALCVGLAIVGGGITSPMMFSVAGITIAIGLLFKPRIGNLFLIVSLLVSLGLALLQQRGFPFPRFFTYSPVSIWFLFALTLIFMNRVMDLAMRKLENALALARQEIARREVLEAQLRYQGIHDGLTGIYNRGFFEEELTRLEHSRKSPVSVIVADVDNLKMINDTQGHIVGDEVLRRITAVLRSIFRADDMLARIGGDEFAILLPETDSITVEQMLLRVNAKISEQNIQHPDLPLHISLGAATAEPGNLTAAFIIADQRMYADKAIHKAKRTPSAFTEHQNSVINQMI